MISFNNNNKTNSRQPELANKHVMSSFTALEWLLLSQILQKTEESQRLCAGWKYQALLDLYLVLSYSVYRKAQTEFLTSSDLVF